MGHADLHLHTTASDGTLSPRALVNELRIRRLRKARPHLDVVAITDHDTLDGAYAARDYLARLPDPGFELLIGVEVSSRDGHILGIGVGGPVLKGLDAKETVAAIHEAGGLAIAAHPYAYLPISSMREFNGIDGRITDPSLGLDAVEVLNSNPTETFNNLRTLYVNRRGLRLAEIGSSDAHFRSAIGHAYTSFPGTTAEDLVRAIRTGETAARGRVYGPFALLEYFRTRHAWRRMSS